VRRCGRTGQPLTRKRGQRRSPERGLLVCTQGDYPAAIRLYEECLGIQKELGDRPGIANTLGNLGIVAYLQGDYASARLLSEESLAIQRTLGNRPGIAFALHNSGRAISAEGDSTRAAALQRESLLLFVEVSSAQGIADTLDAFAVLDLARGRAERAAQLWGAVQGLRDDRGAPLPPGRQQQLAQNTAAVSALLGEERYAAAFEAGREMTVDEAVALALSTD
jgi:hypothetical protein